MNVTQSWPCLLADLPAVPMTIRTLPSDFQVTEIPAYEPSGEGDHIYITVQKTGVSTQEAIQRLARGLGTIPSLFGYAGMKDARAVAVQTLSVEHLDPDRISGFADDAIRILSVSRHRNKIKVGHLKGNHFVIKLRQLDPALIPVLRQGLERLAARGVPNYFGSQRFGMRGDGWEIGRALVREDYERAACFMAGNPGPFDSGRILQARELFMQGRYREAAPLWPSGMSYCGILCRLMDGKPGNFRRGVRSLDKKILKFFIAAFQAKLFNEMLARRLSKFDQVQAGDWAVKHETGGLFKVEDEAAENIRAARFEISAAAPLFGRKARLSEKESSRLEEEVLAEHGVQRSDFQRDGILAADGDQRPLRFKLEAVSCHAGSDAEGDYFELQARLPAGCYMTALLREIAKEKLQEIQSSARSAVPPLTQG